MAAAASWQQSLKAELLKPVLDDFELFTEQGSPEEADIRILTWCFAILKKPATDLPNELKAGRVGELTIEALHRAIEKVATQQLTYLQLNYQIATLDEMQTEKTPCETKESEKDGFQIVDLKTKEAALWKEKIELLEKWKADPSLILPKGIYDLVTAQKKI